MVNDRGQRVREFFERQVARLLDLAARCEDRNVATELLDLAEEFIKQASDPSGVRTASGPQSDSVH